MTLKGLKSSLSLHSRLVRLNDHDEVKGFKKKISLFCFAIFCKRVAVSHQRLSAR
jgi:hypothetical protein